MHRFSMLQTRHRFTRCLAGGPSVLTNLPSLRHYSSSTTSSGSIEGTKTAGSSETNNGSTSKKRNSSDLLGTMLGFSIFPISFWWMTKDDFKEERREEVPSEAVPSTAVAPAFGKMTVEQVPRPQLGGPFRLRDANGGEFVTDVDVFRGKWSLLYFGFSKCAEICPSTMKFIAELIAESDRLYGGADDAGKAAVEAEKLQAVFLSIDYIRDTPEIVNHFVSRFEDKERLARGKPRRLMGLCGERDDVENAARQWRVYFSSYDESEEEKIAREAKGIPLPEIDDTYQFDHSSAIYLVGPDGKMKDFFFREIGVKNTVERLGLHFQDVYGINGN